MLRVPSMPAEETRPIPAPAAPARSPEALPTALTPPPTMTPPRVTPAPAMAPRHVTPPPSMTPPPLDADTPPLPGLARPAAAEEAETPLPFEPTPARIEEWISRELEATPRPGARGSAAPAPIEASEAPELHAMPAPERSADALPDAPSPAADSWGDLESGGFAESRPLEHRTPRPWFEEDSARTPLRPRWPSGAELEGPPPLWRRPWVWGVVMAALFAGGWLVGGLNQSRPGSGEPSGISRALRAIGLGGARFDVRVNTRPEGAWIAVDGRELTRRTPATIDLPIGKHVVTVSFSDLGGASYNVTGERGQQLSIDAPLWGSLVVRASDAAVPVTVELDGAALGYVPVMLDSLLPGPHELRFTGPGMVPWGQTVEVRVREQAEVIARPMTSPATGILEVRAVIVDEQGEEPLEGGEVWIDGELRGRTPLTLELPRGPHSARVAYHGESSPVQVIDLPGGNQRFAHFDLGTGVDRPRLVSAGMPERVAPEQAVVASAQLSGIPLADVKEMWLHVRTPDGPWRRYQMDVLKSNYGVVGVSVYPTTLFDPQGVSRYYMSALTRTGDEYFTEITAVRLEGARRSATAP